MASMEMVANLERYSAAGAAAQEPGGAGGAAARIKVLKNLTLALLREVEALRDAQPRAANDHICLSEEVRRFESELIRWALARTGGHQRRAARLLNIKVTTLHAKIKRYGIEPQEAAAQTGAESQRPAAHAAGQAARPF